MLARRLSPRPLAATADITISQAAPRSRKLRNALCAVLALLFLLQLAALLRAPQAWLPASVTLRLTPGESASLEPLAHASVQRDADGAWRLVAFSAPAGALLLRTDAPPESLASVPLPAGFLTLPGGHRVARQPAAAGSVAFSFAGDSWRFDGATLLRNGYPQPDCPDARWSTRLAAAWNRHAPAALAFPRPLSLGGNLHCGNRIGIPGEMPDTASIASRQEELRVTDLEHAPHALAGVQAIAFGPMRLEIGAGATPDSITLHPQRRVPQFAAPTAALATHAEWQWKARTLWPAVPQDLRQAGLALALGAAVLATLLRAPGPAAAAQLAAGLLALALQRIGQPPAAALSLLLAALALANWLSVPAARTAAIGCAAVLAATGLLLQLELGLGGSDLRYFQKTSALLATGLGAMTLWRLVPQPWRTALAAQRTVERILLLLAALALAALAAQVAWGDETGVWDMQPVELAKLALCALTAHCLALRFSWHDGPKLHSTPARWLALAAPALLFLALLALALVQVDDYSPLILLSLWAGATALAYSCAAGHRLAAALLLTAAGAAFGVAAPHAAGNAALPSGFYADRFQVWIAPGEHPHTGQQLLRGASAIAQGGMAGADSSFGLRSAGLPAGDAIAIPAVQDDFAPSFFLNRHGLLAGLALWCLQAAFLACLLWQAWRCLQQAHAARAYQQAWSARFRYFALAGGAALVAGHLLLSWGTNLAILPVMGQPMSFMSAGGSHLLFFLLPLLGLSAASNEE